VFTRRTPCTVGRCEDADCVIETSEDTLRDMLSGRQKAQTAMLSGKVKVRGDVAIAAKISDLF
jgi:putative sterol carrier protein